VPIGPAGAIVAAARKAADPAALPSGRGSDDASGKKAGSPKHATSHVTTVALSDPNVTLKERFKNIIQRDELVDVSLDAEALQFITETLLGPALRVLSASRLNTEAAFVHVAAHLLQQALVLLPLGPRTAVKYEGDAVTDEISLVDRGAAQPLQLSYEKYFRAGTFKGRVELQVVRASDKGDLFAGAVEVKRGNISDHIEQARKEAFSMWCHNALLESYEPVWVVLTDLKEVLRITYDGQNYPGRGKKPYYKDIPCAEVHGEIRSAGPFPLLNNVQGKYVCTSVTHLAVQVFIGGLLGEGSHKVGDLRQRYRQANEVVLLMVAAAMDAGGMPDEFRSKRRRIESSGTP